MGVAQPNGPDKQEKGGGEVLAVGVCVGVGVGVAVMEADADSVIEAALDTVLADDELARAVAEPDDDDADDADAVTVEDVARDSVGDGAAEKEGTEAVGENDAASVSVTDKVAELELNTVTAAVVVSE